MGVTVIFIYALVLNARWKNGSAVVNPIIVVILYCWMLIVRLECLNKLINLASEFFS